MAIIVQLTINLGTYDFTYFDIKKKKSIVYCADTSQVSPQTERKFRLPHCGII